MNDRERLEMIDALLDELSDMAEDRVVLIEGLKDRAALGRLIGDFRCIMVQREGGPLRAAETLFDNHDKAVILTDWDNKGESIAADLERHLSSLGIEYDSSIRRRLGDLCRKDIKDIESLDSLYARLSAMF